MKCMFRYSGVDYLDYNAIYITQWRNTLNESKYGFFSYPFEKCLLADPEFLTPFLDKTIKPADGDELYLAPTCPYPKDDVRKHYVSKKVPDTGKYNVFLSQIEQSRNACYFEDFIIIPGEKTVLLLASEISRQNSDPLDLAKKYFPTLKDKSEITFVKTNRYLSLYAYDFPEIYQNLTKGLLTKPCIPYESLNVTGTIDLTVDQLDLIYRLGCQSNNSENNKNFVLQCGAFNQYNWRDYPTTVYMLFNFYKVPNYSVLDSYRRCPSQCNKIMSQLFDGQLNTDFATEKDLKLTQEFIKHSLGIQGDKMFVPTERLLAKLDMFRGNINIFNQLFSTVTRIKEVEYEKK